MAASDLSTVLVILLPDSVGLWTAAPVRHRSQRSQPRATDGSDFEDLLVWGLCCNAGAALVGLAAAES
jgi:hypothetical protein